MTDNLDAKAEFAALEEKQRAVGLNPDEQSRWDELRRLGAGEPDTAALPISSGFEGWGEPPGASLPEPAPPAAPGTPAEEATAVLWDQGPVEAPPPLPPPDPDFEAVVVEVPEDAPVEAGEPVQAPAPAAVPAEEPVPEISAEEVQEVEEAAEPVLVAAVSWLDEEPSGEEVVSLDALLVTPPPVHAESLAPPLPPPGHAPPPVPVRAAAAPQGDADPFSPSPSFVAGEHRVVLHTVGGQVLRGSIANADLQDPELPMVQPNGAVARIPAGLVKAIFFMLAAGERPPQATGTRVRVTFGDGRQVSGLAPDYSPGAPGFFVLPLDSRTHTSRVWVYQSAIRQISVG